MKVIKSFCVMLLLILMATGFLGCGTSVAEDDFTISVSMESTTIAYGEDPVIIATLTNLTDSTFNITTRLFPVGLFWVIIPTAAGTVSIATPAHIPRDHFRLEGGGHIVQEPRLLFFDFAPGEHVATVGAVFYVNFASRNRRLMRTESIEITFTVLENKG